jgi:hypothetical protein
MTVTFRAAANIASEEPHLERPWTRRTHPVHRSRNVLGVARSQRMELEQMAKQIQMDSGLMKAAVWSGIALIVAMVVAQLGLMHFIPPPSPALSAHDLAQRFIDRRDEIRLGSLIQCMFWGLWATWTMAITVFIRKTERGFPILTYCSIALNGGGYVFFLLCPVTWAVIAFRPETLDPELMQFMNDWVWFVFLFTWPPFSVVMAIFGIAIIKDHNVPTLYPRWVAYLNFWTAILIFPAGLIVFFKTGLFAYDGVGAFWMPFAVFFGWMITMTVTTLQAINRQKGRLEAEASPTPAAL